MVRRRTCAVSNHEKEQASTHAMSPPPPTLPPVATARTPAAPPRGDLAVWYFVLRTILDPGEPLFVVAANPLR
jgi:hypothetical protein